MKRTVRLTESDLARIVRKIIKEGLIVPTTKYTSSNGDTIALSCNKAIVGTADPATQYKNNPYLIRGESEILPLTGETLKFFCGSRNQETPATPDTPATPATNENYRRRGRY